MQMHYYVNKSVSCTTITTNNNAITYGSLNSGSWLIKTTGSIESGSITASTCYLSDFYITGAFSGLTLVSIGNVTAFTDLMNLQGTLNCYVFNIVNYASSSIITASITTAGNASFLPTTLTGGDLVVKNATKTTTQASINNIGFVTCDAIVTNSYSSKNVTDNVGLLSNNTGGVINFANDASRTTAINIGNSFTNMVFGGGSILGTTLSFPIISSFTRVNTILVQPTGTRTGFDLCSTQTATLNIGTAPARTGNINIGTGQTTGTRSILIGSSALTGAGAQTIKINMLVNQSGVVDRRQTK